jgi:hypothetical protein
MTKVLFLGSSHLGAIKRGWDHVATEYQDFDVSFFGAPADVVARMELTPEGVFGITPKAKITKVEAKRVQSTFDRTTVKLGAYDHVVVVGHRIEEIANAQLLIDFSVAGLNENPDSPPMTRETYNALIDGYIATHLPAPAWRKQTATRLLYVTKPRMADSCLVNGGNRAVVWVDMVHSGRVPAAALEPFMQRAVDVFHDAGLRLITSPPEVFGPSGLTQAKFSRAVAPDPGERQSDNDFDHTHMNAAFGEIMVHKIMSALNANP